MHYFALLIHFLSLGLFPYFYYPSITVPLTSAQSFGSVSCGEGFGVTTQTGDVSTLAPNDDESVRLQELGRAYFEEGKYQKAYDTLRHYVETCHSHLAPFAISFGDLTMSNDARNEDPNRFVEYRNWLKSVLYINSDPEYYCRVVDAIRATLFYHETRGAMDLRADMAICKFMLETGKCPGAAAWESYMLGREADYKKWKDTVKVDTTLYPYDTTLRTLEDLGLGLLRGQNAVANDAEVNRLIAGMSVSENPFKQDNEATIELTNPVLARLSLHDAMGKLLWGSNDLVRMQEGKSSYLLATSGLASGTYYLRLATSLGEVRTIKLTKVK